MAVFYAKRSAMEKLQPKSTISEDTEGNEITVRSLPYVPNIIEEIPVFTDLATKDLLNIGVTRKKIYMRKPKDY